MGIFSELEIRELLRDLPEWGVEGETLTRTYKLPSFSHAVLLLSAIGQLAESAGHHPDLFLHGYKYLTVNLTTHSAGELTEKDFQLAEQIERLPRKQSK
jgi:4a-hydroxytetrahydrobiopterin dehydratase